jgi:hypothetical protein
MWFVYVISETTDTEARNKAVIHYLHFLTENAMNGEQALPFVFLASLISFEQIRMCSQSPEQRRNSMSL